MGFRGQVLPSTGVAQDSATDGQSWEWSDAAGEYVPFTSNVHIGRDHLVAIAGDNTLTLGADPLPGSLLLWKQAGGTGAYSLLWPTIDYAINGRVVTTASLSGSDVLATYYLAATTPDASILSAVFALQATFTGPDNPAAVPNADTGQVWHTDSGTWGIIANQLYASSLSGDNHGYYDAGVFNGTVQATLATMTVSSALCFRYQDENNHWLLNVGTGNSWILYKRQNGLYTQVGAAGPGAGNGDQLKVVLNGTSITVDINGALFQAITDATFQTATKVGFREAANNAARWDNLTVQ